MSSVPLCQSSCSDADRWPGSETSAEASWFKPGRSCVARGDTDRRRTGKLATLDAKSEAAASLIERSKNIQNTVPSQRCNPYCPNWWRIGRSSFVNGPLGAKLSDTSRKRARCHCDTTMYQKYYESARPSNSGYERCLPWKDALEHQSQGSHSLPLQLQNLSWLRIESDAWPSEWLGFPIAELPSSCCATKPHRRSPVSQSRPAMPILITNANAARKVCVAGAPSSWHSEPWWKWQFCSQSLNVSCTASNWAMSLFWSQGRSE